VKAEEQDDIDKIDNETYKKLFQCTGGYITWAVSITFIMLNEKFELMNSDFWAEFSQ